MGMSLSSNGVWSAMPFLAQIISKLGLGLLADWIKLKGVSANAVTKAFNALGEKVELIIMETLSNVVLMLKPLSAVPFAS